MIIKHTYEKTCLCVCECVYLRDDALLSRLLFPHHGVGFSRSGLTVGEYTDIVALEGVKQHLLPNVQIDLPLGRERRVVLLHTHTHGTVSSEPRSAGDSSKCSAGSYRAVRPVGIVKAEVLGCFFGLFGVPDA